MISKIERGESSPTAVVLGKLSAALELSVSELLAPGATGAGNPTAGQAGAGGGTGLAGDPTGGGVVRRAADTPEWRDPDTGYLRRQVSTPRFPAAVTEVTLPPGARVPYPAGAYAFIAQLVWVLSGQLTLTDGPAVHALAAGDTFELGEPRPREFRNDGAGDCRYLVVVTRTATPLNRPRWYTGPVRRPRRAPWRAGHRARTVGQDARGVV
jgi:quercetin dioxygenase-like cupin family protein